MLSAGFHGTITICDLWWMHRYLIIIINKLFYKINDYKYLVLQWHRKTAIWIWSMVESFRPGVANIWPAGQMWHMEVGHPFLLLFLKFPLGILSTSHKLIKDLKMISLSFTTVNQILVFSGWLKREPVISSLVCPCILSSFSYLSS